MPVDYGEYADTATRVGFGADRQVLDAVAHIGDFGQYLARALIFRAVTNWIFSQEDPENSADKDDPWARAVGLACQFAALPDL